MNDEAFVKELFAKTNAEDARTCFAEHGIEISPEEINQITETLKKVRSGEISPESLTNASACKLSDDELDQVSGGIVPIVVLGAVVVAGVAAAAYLGNEIYERGKEAEEAREQSTPGD